MSAYVLPLSSASFHPRADNSGGGKVIDAALSAARRSCVAAGRLIRMVWSYWALLNELDELPEADFRDMPINKTDVQAVLRTHWLSHQPPSAFGLGVDQC
jgi:hypothetical protein